MNISNDQLDDLTKAVTRFGEDVTRLKLRRIRMVSALFVSVLLDICLSVGLIVVAIDQGQNARTIKSVQCSLYALVISAGYHPELHTKDLAVYHHGYTTILADSKRLGCPEVRAR